MSTGAMLLLLSLLQGAQPVPQAPRPVLRTPARTAAAPTGSRLVPFAVATTAFDSNINHARDDIDAYGAAVGGGLIFRNNPAKPHLEVQYEAGLHRYANTDRWNRLSQRVRAQWSARLSKRFELETVGEASLKGSTEDRELSNQFVVSPRLEFRLTPAFRVRGYGAARLKRYDDDAARNAFNRYGGAELAGRFRGGTRWSAGGRYEWNGAESRRQQYARWTCYADYERPVGPNDRLEFETRFRVSHYPYRLVEVEDGDEELRRDRRVEPAIAWTHAIDSDLEFRVGYAFSGRDSNDPRRDYQSHNVSFSILQRW